MKVRVTNRLSKVQGESQIRLSVKVRILVWVRVV